MTDQHTEPDAGDFLAELESLAGQVDTTTAELTSRLQTVFSGLQSRLMDPETGQVSPAALRFVHEHGITPIKAVFAALQQLGTALGRLERCVGEMPRAEGKGGNDQVPEDQEKHGSTISQLPQKYPQHRTGRAAGWFTA